MKNISKSDVKDGTWKSDNKCIYIQSPIPWKRHQNVHFNHPFLSKGAPGLWINIGKDKMDIRPRVVVIYASAESMINNGTNRDIDKKLYNFFNLWHFTVWPPNTRNIFSFHTLPSHQVTTSYVKWYMQDIVQKLFFFHNVTSDLRPCDLKIKSTRSTCVQVLTQIGVLGRGCEDVTVREWSLVWSPSLACFCFSFLFLL